MEEQEALFDLTVHVVLQAHESIDAVVAAAVKMPSRAARLAFYELSRQICIDSGRQTGQAGGGSRRARAPVPQQQSPARPLRVPAESSLPRDRLARALYVRDEIFKYVTDPCAMWMTQRQAPLKPHVPVDVLTKINKVEAAGTYSFDVLFAVAIEMESRADRLRFYEEEKRSCIERLARRRDDRIRQQGERSAPTNEPTRRARPYAPPKPAQPGAEPRW